jgi:hypothetical protein
LPLLRHRRAQALLTGWWQRTTGEPARDFNRHAVGFNDRDAGRTIVEVVLDLLDLMVRKLAGHEIDEKLV